MLFCKQRDFLMELGEEKKCMLADRLILESGKTKQTMISISQSSLGKLLTIGSWIKEFQVFNLLGK